MHLSDASSFFVSLRVWEEGPFHENDVLSHPRIDEIRSRSEFIAVRTQALALLSRAEHSRFLLVRKLHSRGMTDSTIQAVLDELESSGALSDKRYAASWVRSRVKRHPEGRPMLLAGLRQRGVHAALAEDAVHEVLGEEGSSAEELARALADRLARNPRSTPESIAVRMLRRGFDRGLVSRVIREVAGPQANEFLAE